MQAVLFTPKKGLVDRLGLDWELAFQAMRPAYLKFNHTPISSEDDFWKAVGEEMGVDLPLELVYEIDKEIIVPNPQAREALDLVKSEGLKIGIISNNTDFWYKKVIETLNLNEYVDPNLVFVSHEYGVSKPVGLFKKALEVVNPKGSLFIDDRSDNIYVANYLGFAAMQYSMNEKTTGLLDVVKYGLGI